MSEQNNINKKQKTKQNKNKHHINWYENKVKQLITFRRISFHEQRLTSS